MILTYLLCHMLFEQVGFSKSTIYPLIIYFFSFSKDIYFNKAPEYVKRYRHNAI